MERAHRERSRPVTAARDLILEAFRSALRAVDPEAAVRQALTRNADGCLVVEGRDLGLPRCVEVIAVGKAAVPMMAGVNTALGVSVRRGFVITKDGHLDRPLPSNIEIHEAAHPVLDARSVEATKRLLEWVREIPEDALVVCLISGGGSALLEAPVEGVSLADFQEMTRQLLRAGADIHQLNAVRSRVSRVKGGGLRVAIPARRVVTLALSDVLGNDPTVIASGPTVRSTTTAADARRVLAALGVADLMPEAIHRALQADVRRPATPEIDDVISIVADNERAIRAAANRLHGAGLTVLVDDEQKSGEARICGTAWVEGLPRLPGNVDVVLAGGELTVTVRGEGIGGRNTEFALAAAIVLERLDLAEWTVASLASDGQDAETGVAGAIVDASVPARLRTAGVDPDKALAANDTFPGLNEVGVTVETGPTGTNVNDLYFAVRNRLT